MEKKKLDVVLGLQWGDEGKGKVVDVLTPSYKVVARFQGGPNAGHSLVFDGDSFVLHTVPSGIFREGTVNVIGNGVVIDPVILMEEIHAIEKRVGPIDGKVVISKRAHLILPTHRTLDAASEAAKGKTKIGSTLKGIGPTYMDKTGRNGLRIGDILSGEFAEKYNALKQKHFGLLAQYNFSYDITEYEKQWMAAVEELKRFPFVDTEVYLNRILDEGTPILAEGAQGSLLDIDFGTYPFVTSSNTLSSGVCTGLGIAPSRVGNVYGIFKAYCTRVGSGPFPTELFDEDGEKLRAIGHEYGAIIMMKSDVLDAFDTVKVAVAYKEGDKVLECFPYDGGKNVTPIYKEFPGWKTPLSGLRHYEEFPEAFKQYIAFIEAETGCRIKIVSVGPDREATVIR